MLPIHVYRGCKPWVLNNLIRNYVRGLLEKPLKHLVDSSWTLASSKLIDLAPPSGMVKLVRSIVITDLERVRHTVTMGDSLYLCTLEGNR